MNVGAVDTVHVDESGTPLTAHEVYTKDAVDTTFATKTEVNAKADSTTVTEQGTKITQLETAVGNTYTKGEVDTKLSTKADSTTVTEQGTKITQLETAVDNTYTKAEADGKFATSDALNTAKTDLEGKITANTTKITDLSGRMTTAENNITDLKDEDVRLAGKIDQNAHDITGLKDKDVELSTKIDTNQAAINQNKADITQNKNDIKDTNDRTGGIARNTEKTQTTIEGSVKVDNQGNVKEVKGLAAETITTSGNADLKGNVILGTNTANTVTVNGNADFNEAVNMDKGLTVTNGATTLKETTVDGKLTAGDADLKNTKVEGTLGVTGEATLDGALTAKGEAKFEKNVTVEKDLTVNGKLNVGEIYMEHNKLESTGEQHNSATSITADGISNLAKVTDENGNTTESKFTHNEKGTFNYAKKEGNTSSTRQDSKGIYGYAKDKDGNKSYTKQEGNRIAESVIGQDGKETKSEMTSTDITNTAKDGTITSDAKDKDGTITSDAKDIVNKATGNIFNSSATMDTTVTGKATESYGELETEVKGNEKHTVKGDQTNEVDGKQINTIKNGQENIISGGQTNTITGGQINNITGDQTTTITGNKTETVTENVTEDYKKNLTTTVGGNEIHVVKGTKTETVEGKLTENFKGGQETNVSGTQTINATDINRNASSGMIDTVDNAYGTNKETKVAGSTTTEVSIKGTRESGTYIRGATEARDYIIKGTLSNSETKTAEATSTEITDGNGKTSATIQDKTQISGSVTNGTSSAVSNVKADSIDTAVKEGTNTSLISQKKDSITSAVGNGTTSTVIQQGDKDITIASNGGTVGIVGKDIINNATDEITNTAGTKITDKVGNNTRVIDQTSITDTVGTASRKIEDGKITDTAGDSTVTTENGKGTTFAKTGSTAYSTKAGAPMDTNIAGNHITTGRVDANELAVSDTDGNNKADLLVKAGEGVKASASDGNTTGSLDVKADGITTSITNGTDHNTVSSTLAGGTIFTNSEAAVPVTGASGAGTAVNTTIKGNTITTGKVTMDYAEVMKDLGVHGNANITGKTTTGSLEVTGTSTLKGNVTMESDATVKKNLTVNGITTTKTLKVTENAEIDGNATIAGDVTANSYKVGDKTYIDANGIHANGQKITDVADGSISEGSKDAVNGGQLYGVKRDLEHQVDKVGANAAAMANLRPMEFDSSSKWNIAAAIGNYGSETAAALGAFYRPNDDVMVNLSTAFGTGENMVGGGVSVRLGKGGNKLSREENNALKDQVNDLTARMDALLSVLNPNMSKDFPDVPENHWAYEAVSRLAGNDIVQGYPDGEFHGERTMTRYEMAEIIYNALSRGAEAERELVEEFKPELQAMAASEKATAEKAEG